MKISLFIPKGKKNLNNMMKKELASAENIKDKATRKSVIEGLNKINSELSDGMFYLWDGSELVKDEYGGKDFLYHCGKEFKSPDISGTENNYLLVTMDADYCTIGVLDGKKIKTIWQKESDVPRKHNKGGQSKERFQRDREQRKKQWLKKVSDKVKEIYDNLN